MSDTRALVTDIYSAYERRDFERVASYLHDDIDWIIYGPIQIFPFQGPRHGKVAVLEALTAIARDYKLESYQPETIIVEGDRAAVLSNARFVQRSSQRTMRFKLANFLRLQDGKIIEFRELADTLDAVEQALGRWIEL